MTKSTRTNLIIVILIGFVIIAGILGMLKFARENQQSATRVEMFHDTLFPHPRTIQPFSLRNGDTSFTDHSLKGHWTIFFFGYTHCPDICPTTLATMNKVWEQLSPEAQEKTQMVFVSIDPDRDSPESVEKYATYFNPHFKGVTGSAAQLAQFTHQVGVAYFKVESEDKENYIMNHTGSLMIFNPLGQYAGVISPPLIPNAIASELDKIVTSS